VSQRMGTGRPGDGGRTPAEGGCRRRCAAAAAPSAADHGRARQTMRAPCAGAPPKRPGVEIEARPAGRCAARHGRRPPRGGRPRARGGARRRPRRPLARRWPLGAGAPVAARRLTRGRCCWTECPAAGAGRPRRPARRPAGAPRGAAADRRPTVAQGVEPALSGAVVQSAPVDCRWGAGGNGRGRLYWCRAPSAAPTARAGASVGSCSRLRGAATPPRRDWRRGHAS